MSLIAAIKAKNANEVRDSIARGVDVNEIDRDTNYTPLCVAAQTGDVEIVRILLEAGATLDSNYGSPLEEACWNGHLEVIREITRFYPYSEDLHKIYAETLISATIRGHVEIVRCLANAGVDLNAILDDDGTALHYAVDRGQIKVVHTLIDLDVDVNTANDEGETPLAKVLDKRLIESLQFWTNLTTLLIEAGADVNATDNAGETPLMKVARHHREDICQQFLQAGAVVNACDKQGKTALIVASESGSSAVTKCLIEAGADVNLSDRDGNTALTYVESALLETPKVEDEETDDEFFCKSDRFHNKLEQQKRARQQRIAKYLREGDAIDRQRELMLVKAAKDGKLGEVEALIDTGTPVDRIVPQYGTALLQAVQNGHREIVETLLEEGADPNLVFENRYHGIPLIEAAENGFLDIVRLLLDAGANPHITDADDEEYEGRTAVDRAQMKGHWEIVQLLRERGGPRQTRLPIAEQRGLVSEYLNDRIILVKGDVEKVAEALYRVRNATVWERDVFEKEVELTNECFIVFQFHGHSWTVIHEEVIYSWNNGLKPEDAQAISQQLQTQEIEYGVSDTAGAIGYKLYDCGELLEEFYDCCENDFSDKAANPEPHTLYGEDWKFYSIRRQIEASDVQEPFDFVDEFFKSQDAYVPAWGVRGSHTCGIGKRRKLAVIGLDPYDLRMDFVAV